MLEPVSSSVRHKFLADVMLGSLARWLRILGYDTCYDNRVDDDDLIARCVADGRIALTRDRRLIQRKALTKSIFINSDNLGGQLREVLAFTGDHVDERLILTRCLECNRNLQPATRSAVRDLVPSYVYRTQPRFQRCPECNRVYWAGTHRERMMERIDRLLNSDRGPSAT
jgi:uncharacterized protein with PIN domain